MKVIIFGAGHYARQYLENCPQSEEIVAVCDNNWKNMAGILWTQNYFSRLYSQNRV
ncbi:hypothetical protein FACS1894216_11780 [Synergistales bacterium]|nr:hypothetical protein FACS1894216_11780 [Synergistales bacterium]